VRIYHGVPALLAALGEGSADMLVLIRDYLMLVRAGARLIPCTRPGPPRTSARCSTSSSARTEARAPRGPAGRSLIVSRRGKGPTPRLWLEKLLRDARLDPADAT